MTPPRFYAPEIKLAHDFWLHDEQLVRRWQKLGYQTGQRLVLFDGRAQDRLYRLEELSTREAHLVLITDFEHKPTAADTYLLWRYSHASFDDILKTYTIQGVTHFLPFISGPADIDFNEDRAKRILIEASEQSGRSHIPSIRQPMHLQTALDELKGKTKVLERSEIKKADIATRLSGSLGYVIQPEDDWTSAERAVLEKYGVAKS